MTSTIGKLGRSGRSPHERGAFWLGQFALPQFYDAPPPFDDWTGSIEYNMFGNDRLQNCTSVGLANMFQQRCALIGEKCTITVEQVVDHYSRATGYRAGEPHTDQGGQNRDALKECRDGGLGAYGRDLIWMRVNVHDQVELRAAVHAFGSVYIGADLPKRIAEQGDTWFVPTKRDARDIVRSLGGHAWILTGYERDRWHSVSWRRRIVFDDFWCSTHVDEGFVVIDRTWVTKARAAPNGFDLDRLVHNMLRLGRPFFPTLF